MMMCLICVGALGFSSITSSKRLLSKSEEQKLALLAQDEQRLQAVRQQVATALERQPTAAEWAEAAGETVAGLQQRRLLARHARNELVESHVPIVKAMVRRYRNLDAQDLEQEGVLGLIHAAEKFDATRNIRFSTYAKNWVRAAISERLRRSRAFYVPQRVYDNAKKIKRYTEEHDDASTIIQDLNVTRKTIRQARLATSAANAHVFEDYLDVTTQDSYNDLRQDLLEALAILDDRQLQVIHLRYGLDDGVPRSVRDCADILHINKDKVRQICLNAFRKLKGTHLAERLVDYMR